jgi:catechol-2,3-dioxygenase
MLEDARITAVIPVRSISRARMFYEKMLGLIPKQIDENGEGVSYSVNGTEVYVYRTEAPLGEATKATFVVGDLTAAMKDLRAHGVVIEEFDLPNLKTVNGVAEGSEGKGAWFKDLDGNYIGLMEAK